MGNEKVRKVIFFSNDVDFHLDARDDFVGDGVVAVVEPLGAKFLKAL